MQSKNINYISELDHLRFLAAVLVFSFHLFHYYFGHWQVHPELAALGIITEGYTGIFAVLYAFWLYFYEYCAAKESH